MMACNKELCQVVHVVYMYVCVLMDVLWLAAQTTCSLASRSEHVYMYQNFFQGGRGWGICPPWLGLACPLDMLRILHIFYMKINDINDTINVCTKLCIMKGPKSNFHRGACPRTPLVCHRLCTRIHTCPPIIHTISFLQCLFAVCTL